MKSKVTKQINSGTFLGCSKKRKPEMNLDDFRLQNREKYQIFSTK